MLPGLLHVNGDQETLSKNNDTLGNYLQAPASGREKCFSGHWSLFSILKKTYNMNR